MQVTLPKGTSGAGLFEGFHSKEGQYGLAKAGFVPVSGAAFGEVLESEVGRHVVAALEHAQTAY